MRNVIINFFFNFSKKLLRIFSLHNCFKSNQNLYSFNYNGKNTLIYYMFFRGTLFFRKNCYLFWKFFCTESSLFNSFKYIRNHSVDKSHWLLSLKSWVRVPLLTWFIAVDNSWNKIICLRKKKKRFISIELCDKEYFFYSS